MIGPTPKRADSRCADADASTQPKPPKMYARPIAPADKPELARREQDQHRDLHVMQDLPQAREPRERQQRAVVPDQLQAFVDLGRHRRAAPGKRHVVAAHATRRSRNAETKNVIASSTIANGAVSELDQQAREPGADQRGRRLAERDLRVGFDQPVAPGHLRKQHLIGRAADHVLHAAEEADRVEDLDRQRVGERRDRYREQRHAAADVGGDDDRQLAHAVEQHARVQADTSANGNVSSATSTPIWNGVACSSSAAVRGSARLVTCAPNAVIVSDVHSLRKSGERQSPPNVLRNSLCSVSMDAPVARPAPCERGSREKHNDFREQELGGTPATVGNAGKSAVVRIPPQTAGGTPAG